MDASIWVRLGGIVTLVGAATSGSATCAEEHAHALHPAVTAVEGRQPQMLLQTGHTASVTALAFSTDGKAALSGSEDETAILWDVATGRILQAYRGGHRKPILAVAISSNRRWVLTGSRDNRAVLWDAASGRPLMTLAVHRNHIESCLSPMNCVRTVAFSPDSRFAVTGSSDHTGVLWDVASGRRVRTFCSGEDSMSRLVFSPDGRFLAAGCWSGTITMWDLASGEEVTSIDSHSDGGRTLAFSPDAHRLLSATAYGKVILWDPFTGRRVQTFVRKDADVLDAVFGKNTGHVFVSYADGYLVDWDTESGAQLRSVPGNSSGLLAAAISPNRRSFLAASDHAVTMKDIRTGKTLISLARKLDPLVMVAFTSHDTPRIVTAHDGRSASFWDASTGVLLRTTPLDLLPNSPPWRGKINCFDRTPDGRRSIVGAGARFAMLDKNDSDMQTEESRCLYGHTQKVTCVALSPDGKLALSGSHDNSAILWDAQTGDKLHTLEGHFGNVRSVAFSPDGKLALTGSDDGTCRIWELSTGKELVRLMPVNRGKDWLAITPQGYYHGSPGGRELVSWRRDGRAVARDPYQRHFHRPDIVSAAIQGRPVQ